MKTELKKFIENLVCETCTCRGDKEDLYYYFDLGGWTRIFCQYHLFGFNESKEIPFGARKLIELIKE